MNNESPEYKQAKYAFVHMVTDRFINYKDKDNNIVTNFVDNINSTSEPPCLFQRIVLDPATNAFLGFVDSNLSKLPDAIANYNKPPEYKKDKQALSDENNRRRKEYEEKRDAYIRALFKLRFCTEQLLNEKLFKGLDDRDAIRVFIAYYYTDEFIHRANLMLLQLRYQLMYLQLLNSPDNQYDPSNKQKYFDSLFEQFESEEYKKYRNQYGPFDWLMGTPVPSDLTDSDLRSLYEGYFPNTERIDELDQRFTAEIDKQYIKEYKDILNTATSKQYKNIIDLIAGEVSSWIKDYENLRSSCIDKNGNLRVDKLIAKIVQDNESSGPLGRFTDDMKRSTPATFGAWILDTTYIPRGVDIPDEIAALSQLRDTTDSMFPPDDDTDDDKKTKDILENAFNCIYNETSDFNRAISPDPNHPTRDLSLPNPRFMFVFGNWGDSLRPHSPAVGIGYPTYYGETYKDGRPRLLGMRDSGFYGDFFSGSLFGSITKNDIWTPIIDEKKSARLIWRDNKNHDTHDRDYIGKFVSATYGTPLWGGYMTDYVKGIPTSDIPALEKALGKNVDKSVDKLYDVMNNLLGQEVGILRKALGAEDDDNTLEENIDPSFEPIVLMTHESYKHFTKVKTNKLRAWQVVRWPHHSGQAGPVFKATTLAYAYGRVARALEWFDEEQSQNHVWQWSFHTYAGVKDNIVVKGNRSLPSIYEWFKEVYKEDSGILYENKNKGIRYVPSDIDAAFLMGWGKENDLIDDFVNERDSVFDNTLRPDFSALEPLKIEIKEFEEEQARQ